MTYSLAVFGDPIAHSLSPQIHRQFAVQAGIDLVYDKVQVSSEGFVNQVEKFFATGGKGLNITVPHKLRAFQLAEERSEAAAQAEAVNTLFLHNGKLRGENTDGFGLLSDMEKNLAWRLAGARVLLLGAGGAAQGVLTDLLMRDPAVLVVANRTYARAAQLVERFNDPRFQVCALEALGELGSFDVIISASSGGLAEQADSSDYLPNSLRSESTCCYDMIYGKDTAFLNWAKQPRGSGRVSDGLGMLVEQAARSFQLWFDVEVDTHEVLKTLRTSI